MVRHCISCGRLTPETIRLTRYRLSDPEAVDSRVVSLCTDCRRESEPFFRGWRTTYTPPFLFSKANAAARCSNPACGKPATNILFVGETSQHIIGFGHEVYVCDACLETLYSGLFGTFEGVDPWTS